MKALSNPHAHTEHGITVEIVACLIVLGYGVLLDRLLPGFSHIPANIIASALAVFLALRAGISMDNMGMEWSKLGQGLKAGLLAIIPILALMALGIAVPWSRKYFFDPAVVGINWERTFLHMFFRIPFGTVAAEEVIFRGALLGLFMKRHRPWVAILSTSLVFGLWHISPTLNSIIRNPAFSDLASGGWVTFGIVFGVVAATTVAGILLSWLRLKAESILAPWIAHTCLNSGAFLFGRIAAHLTK
ncbi:MAG: CPBP family intramembrane metalloprotease [Actinobacteria bacterium]|nr:CPBP family intramembrane metalloprotease [Actinomycetota bacterium]